MDWRKLDRYLAGESSADEIIEVQRWLAGAPERAELVAALRDADGEAAEGDVDASWRRLRSRMHELDTAAATNVPLRDSRPRRARTIGWRAAGRFGRSAVLRAAAVVLLVLSAATWWVYRLDPRGAYAAAEIVTLPGERHTATLPDGSEVIVAPASRVRYRRQGGDSNRVVELEGNAYFRVTADPERPFLVHAGGTETRVLGTEFDVRAFPEDDGVRVVVAEGTVSLSALAQTDDAILLEPGDLGQVRADGGIDVARAVDLEQHLAWTTGGIVFEDVSLGQALPELERRLGIDLRLADSALAARRLTIDLRSDSPGAVIEAISLVLDLSHVQAGDTITLSANP